jgi:hypothetical protein
VLRIGVNDNFLSLHWILANVSLSSQKKKLKSEENEV